MHESKNKVTEVTNSTAFHIEYRELSVSVDHGTQFSLSHANWLTVENIAESKTNKMQFFVLTQIWRSNKNDLKLTFKRTFFRFAYYKAHFKKR